MEAFRMIEETRRNDVNPFREMLQRMGAFGGPTLGDVGGVPPQPGRLPQQSALAQGQQSPDLQKLVQMLISKGVPEDQALQQAQQLMQQRGA